jgi:membrane protease YdiL (CAAX protease family)
MLKWALTAILTMEPYLWLVAIVLAPRFLWDILRNFDTPWSLIFGLTEFPDFANAVTHILLVLVPILSLKLVHRRSLTKTVGLNVDWLYIVSSLGFSLPLFYLSVAHGSFDEVTLAPVLEEMFFRTYLFWLYVEDNKGKGRARPMTAIAFLASNMAFVAVHFIPGVAGYSLVDRFLRWPSVETFMDLGAGALFFFIAGATFSVAYLLTGTVLSSIATHVTWNTFYSDVIESELILVLLFIVEFAVWYLIRTRTESTCRRNESRGVISPLILKTSLE